MDADDFSNENGSLVLTLIDLATQDTMYLMVVHYCIAGKNQEPNIWAGINERQKI